jgi:hypothetical protein
MRRVVLWADSYARRFGYRKTLGECAEVSRFAREADRQKDSNRRSSKDVFQAHFYFS